MHTYQDTITVYGILFHRHPQEESHLWDYYYISEPIQTIEGLPATIKLYVGTRHNDDDLAWNARLYVGKWCIFTDALEYYGPEETVSKCLNKLAKPDTLELVQAYITAQARQS